MFYNLRRRIKTRSFDRVVRGILDTPPLATSGSDLLMVSQLRSADLLMYLLAIKSVFRQIGHGQVMVVDDGLTASDRTILAEHIPGITFRPRAEVDTGACPRGGTWERLCTIVHEARTRYVMQVDADLLAIGPLDLVKQIINENRSFTIATRKTPDFLTLQEISELMKPAVAMGNIHIQPISEANFDRLPAPETTRYIRGCSAFTGFAPGAVDWTVVEDFSRRMEGIVGERWKEWGSEQISSNYAIANTPDPIALPIPDYSNHWGDMDLSDSKLIHFLGTYRFHRGIYKALGRQVIESMTT